MALSRVRPQELLSERLSSPERLQLQALVNPGAQNQREVEENSDDYLGVIGVIDDPFNLYLRVTDLISPSTLRIRFFVYSTGRKSIILWGYYDRRTRSFKLDGYCRPMLSQMGDIIRQWSGWDFQVATYAVSRRNFMLDTPLEPQGEDIKEALAYAHKGLQDLYVEYQGNPPREVLERLTQAISDLEKDLTDLQEQSMVRRLTPDAYRRMKYFIAYQDRKITEDEMERSLGEGALDDMFDTFEKASGLDLMDRDNVEVYYDALNKYTEHLRRLTKQYEELRNIHDPDRDLGERLEPETISELEMITENFYRWVGTGRFSREDFVNSSPKCPKKSECMNDLGTNSVCELYEYGEARDLR